VDGSGGASPPPVKKANTSKKSVIFYHESMEIGLFCSNFIEKSHHSSNPGQNPT
jgi:hypothetical protein